MNQFYVESKQGPPVYEQLDLTAMRVISQLLGGATVSPSGRGYTVKTNLSLDEVSRRINIRGATFTITREKF
jgi:hypothetical protein